MEVQITVSSRMKRNLVVPLNGGFHHAGVSSKLEDADRSSNFEDASMANIISLYRDELIEIGDGGNAMVLLPASVRRKLRRSGIIGYNYAVRRHMITEKCLNIILSSSNHLECEKV